MEQVVANLSQARKGSNFLETTSARSGIWGPGGKEKKIRGGREAKK